MRTILYWIPVMLVLNGCRSHEQGVQDAAKFLSKGKWIDLSYDFSDKTLYWPTAPASFRLDTNFNGMTPGGYYYSAYSFCSPEHGGTHLDAPVHFAEGKMSVDALSIDQLCGNAVVIDVSEMSLPDPDYLVGIADIEAWEKEHATIPDSSIVLFRTGYGSFYPDPLKYFGTREQGTAALDKLHFPGLHPEAAEWLITNRKIKAVGLDTPSIDYGQSKDFKTHQVLMGKNIPAFENVANMQNLPASGIYVMALPMKIKGGSGGPLRIAAWVPATSSRAMSPR